MIKAFLLWLDNRTGIKTLLNEALYERIPGGSRWRYVWGSTLVFTFMVQVITGIFLWMAYSPSRTTAWESVYYIQHEMSGGWFLRGLHHYTAQAMVILLALHLMQVVIDGAYKAPREINFWLGLILMLIVLGLALTGYLLPWDQKGYWATRVATNIAGIAPVVGDATQKLALGGDDYGQLTLTRFFALHAGLLPALLIGFLVLHVAAFRKHGIHAVQPLRKPDEMFWPDQILKDAVACLAVLLTVVFLILWPAISGHQSWDHTGHLGAELGSPADPSTTYSAARPEWYFLFLFQFLKLFEGWGHTGELVGAIIVPTLLLGVLFLMPIVGKWKLGHRFNIMYLFLVLGGAGYLTWAAIHEDTLARGVSADQFAAVRRVMKIKAYDKDYQPDKAIEISYAADRKRFENWQKSAEYLAAVIAANREGERAVELAGGPDKIPATGALDMLRHDPLTIGPRLFQQHCVSCHDYRDPAGKDPLVFTSDRMLLPKTQPDVKPLQVARDDKDNVEFQPSGAPNLYGFGSRAWIRGLLDKSKIAHVRIDELLKPKDAKENNPLRYLGEAFDAPYFGNTKHRSGDMAIFVTEDMEFKDTQLDQIAAALSAEAKLPAQAVSDSKEKDLLAAGQALIADSNNCTQCHHWRGDENKNSSVPDLEGYASPEWLRAFIANPSHERFYGESKDLEGNDRMPAFAKNADTDNGNTMTRKELDLLVRWLRGDP
jgi:quinol-cytochrome oxidoreductase complex cytochrome b subunit/mono/diheme cytochrome c family protein